MLDILLSHGYLNSQELSAPHALTKRDGQWKELAVKELVLGDVIALKGGDIIPADCRVRS